MDPLATGSHERHALDRDRVTRKPRARTAACLYRILVGSAWAGEEGISVVCGKAKGWYSAGVASPHHWVYVLVLKLAERTGDAC